MIHVNLIKFIVLATAIASACLVKAENVDSLKCRNSGGIAYGKFRLGGYGEMLFSHYDYYPDRYSGTKGAPYDNRACISIPRYVLAMDYKFVPSVVLSSEIEFEYGGTGAAMEYEYNEAGEYELEVDHGGEVALEQVHLTKTFAPWLKLRAGHFIVPVGLTNTHHEPINFFGTVRAVGEMQMLPCTWHETGISVLGDIGQWNYNLMLVSGLDPNFFSRDGFIKDGSQKIFEGAKMTDPAFAGRLDFNGIRNTRLGVSAYYASKTTGNSTKDDKMSEIDAPVTIVTADAQYKGNKLVARANIDYGHIGDSYRLSALNATMSKITHISTFSHDAVASDALTYSVEAGYNIGSLVKPGLSVYPFVRYEYYNTMEDVQGSIAKDDRMKCKLLTFGLNYYMLPNLVLKGDYSHRIVGDGNYNNENTLSFAIAYIGWFESK